MTASKEDRLECLGLAVRLAKQDVIFDASVVGRDIVELAEQFVAFVEGGPGEGKRS